MECLHIENDYILIDLKAYPGASTNEVKGIKDKRLCVRIAAQPEDGKANAFLCDFFSKILVCAKRDVVLVKGKNSRMKTVRVPIACNEKLKEIILKTTPS